MSNYFKLRDYRVWTTDKGNTGILISNSRKYYEILRDSFPEYRHYFGPIWPDERNEYEYGFHINKITPQQRAEIIGLLDLFKNTICIDDSLLQTFSLDMHSVPRNEGGGRTKLGDLVTPQNHTKSLLQRGTSRKPES